ncbi:MAG: glycine cleavage T C-terminal barrel domain-containing protein [Planctomycetota bacterium]
MANQPEIIEQYRAVHAVGGVCARTDRSLIEVVGKDRAAWLHNLVTNAVKTLTPGEGNYAFATNIKGRAVFDLNLLVLEDRIWLDVDAREAVKALGHLGKYIITEDVELKDRSGEISRIALFGQKAMDACTSLGFANFVTWAGMQHAGGAVAGAACRLVRDDFTGLPTAEFFITAPHAVAMDAIKAAAASFGLVPVDRETMEVLRIEAGRPASVDDIDEDVVPPESGQIERGISYHKGCYLGQEVIERMRSHGVLIRRLVGIQLDGDVRPERNAKVSINGQDVGRVTSSCWSEAVGAILALGYVKSIHAKPDTVVSVSIAGGERGGRVVSLPVCCAQLT